MNGNPLIKRTFDNQNRETTRTAGSNTQSQLHDRYGCLIKRKWQGQQSAIRRYRWDAENRLEATEDSLTGSTHYQRDSQGQLTQENDTEYHYDLGGNRVPEGGQIEQDRLIRSGDDKRTYDALGAEVRVTGHTTEHRTFDAEGQLIEFKQPELHITYGYDALGRRAWRKTDAGATNYLWHNDVLLGEQSPKGDWQWYLRDPQTDEPLIILIDDQPYYYELDHRMMPLRLWDQDGQKVWEGHADAWGKCQPDTLNHGIHQPLRLPGQFEDELTGIVQNRFRDYDPETGRYLTPDPLGLHGGLNSYRYTQNPVDYIDPFGLCDEQEAQKGVFASLKDGVLNTLAWVDEKTTIPALADLQTSMLEGLDEMGARAHASGNSWAVPLLGVTYAATYTLMPTSALDVVPGGKAGKLGKVAKSGDEVAEAGTQAARHSNTTPATLPTPPLVSRKTPDDFKDVHKSANHRKAAAGEYNAHQLMKEKGFKPLGNTTGDYQPGKNGIDGIYKHPNPPPDYVITEAKYNKAGMCKTADGRQMCDDWVSDKRLEEAGLSEADRIKVRRSLKRNDGHVEKYLIRTKPDGSMTTRLVDGDGYLSGTPNGF